MNIKKYNEIADKNKPQKQVLKHTASAFLVGGVIGMIGEFFLNLYKELFSFSEKEATPIMLITLILIAAILTGLGIYDRLGDSYYRFFKCDDFKCNGGKKWRFRDGNRG